MDFDEIDKLSTEQLSDLYSDITSDKLSLWCFCNGYNNFYDPFGGHNCYTGGSDFYTSIQKCRSYCGLPRCTCQGIYPYCYF